MIQRNFFIALALGFMQLLSAQSRFSANPTSRFLQRSTSFGTLHDFIQIKNYTGDTLQMRWISYPAGGDTAWNVNLQDPENFYADLLALDSADFILPDSASHYSLNKMVIGVSHNRATGIANYKLTLLEKGRRSDSLQINFEVSVIPGMNIKETTADNGLEVYPQPAREVVFIDHENGRPLLQVQLFNAEGRLMPIDLSSLQEGFLNVSSWQPGVYLLIWQGEQSYHSHKIIIKP